MVQADAEQAEAARQALGVGIGQGVELRAYLLVAHNGAGNHIGKAGGEQRVPRQALRRDLAAVYADQPGDLNEGVEGNAQGQTGRLEVPFRMEEQSQVLGQKPGVFEPEQGQQVERQG